MGGKYWVSVSNSLSESSITSLEPCNFYLYTSYIFMVWSQHNPATEAVAQVYHDGTRWKSDHIWDGCPQGEDQNLTEQQSFHELCFHERKRLGGCNCDISSGMFFHANVSQCLKPALTSFSNEWRYWPEFKLKVKVPLQQHWQSLFLENSGKWPYEYWCVLYA